MSVSRRGPGESYWRRLVLLFFLGWVFVYANRAVLAPLLAVLQAEWGLSAAQLGLINSAFFLVYTLVQVPTGLLADRLGRRRLLLPGYLLHGVGALASGLAPGAAAFLGARMVTGLGQGTYYATQYALASAVIPPRRRALGMAVINSGMAFGLALGMLVASASLSAWRRPFVVLGGATILLWAVLRGAVKPDPHAEPGRRGPDADPAPGVGRAAPRPGRGRRTILLAYLVAFTTMYGFFVILTWLPYYLETQRGVSGVGAGVVSTGVAFAAVPAGVIAGRLSDHLGRRRPVLLALTPLAGIALAGIVLAPSVGWVYLFVLVYGFSGKLVVDPLIVALVADATPPAGYGAAFGILNFAGTLATVLAPALTGYLADVSGGFETAFLLAAGLGAMAAAGVLAMGPEAGKAGLGANSS